MKGMTPEEFVEITKFVKKHCKFGYVPDEDRYPDGPMMIKYMDICWDSRFGDVWSITFRGSDIRLATNHFNVLNPNPKDWKYNTLTEWAFAYLKGEWQPTEDFIKKQ
tara:strand:+ start:941 stop:1261 length:321 start_codon:yes stop_codon:yes gene_type:complete